VSNILRTLLVAACVAAGGAIGGGEAKAEPLKITITPPDREREYERWWNLQLRCMADAIYTEARGESPYAQRMVAYVILRRMWEARPEWPQSPCGNVYHIRFRKDGEMVSQFEGPVHKPVGVSDTDREYLRSTLAALEVMQGFWKPEPQHTCVIAYQNKVHARGSRQGWFKKLDYVGDIDQHSFYCLPSQTAGR
jgi:spore germination cell wall hydrolase CwlJ-like protein